MNTKQLITGAALALIGVAASAQTAEAQFGFITASQPSALSRQAVQAELTRARQAGELPAIDPVSGMPAKAQPVKYVTRAQVQAEQAQALAGDSTDASNGFGFINNNYASTLTRDEVRNEAVAAARAKKSAAPSGI